MSDSGEATNPTTFFDNMPVEDFISLIDQFLDQPTNTFEIDAHMFDLPPGFEEILDHEPTSSEAPIVNEPGLDEPGLDETREDEPTPADSNHTHHYEFSLDVSYTEYDGWGDAEFKFDPTDHSYTQWSNAYEYAHDYAESVWGDSHSW